MQQVHLATGVYSLVSQNSGNNEIYNCYQILLLGILATLIFFDHLHQQGTDFFFRHSLFLWQRLLGIAMILDLPINIVAKETYRVTY